MLLCVLLALSCTARSPAASRYALWQQAAVAATRRGEVSAVVPAQAEGQQPRIGRFAGEAFASLGSTTQGVRAAKAHRLLLNGAVVPPERRVRSGDVVTLLPPSELSVAGGLDDERLLRFAEGLLASGAHSHACSRFRCWRWMPVYSFATLMTRRHVICRARGG